jgi:hypothetical protein
MDFIQIYLIAETYLCITCSNMNCSFHRLVIIILKLIEMIIDVKFGIPTLAANIAFMYTSFNNGKKSETLWNVFSPIYRRVQITFIFPDNVPILSLYCKVVYAKNVKFTSKNIVYFC